MTLPGSQQSVMELVGGGGERGVVSYPPTQAEPRASQLPAQDYPGDTQFTSYFQFVIAGLITSSSK